MVVSGELGSGVGRSSLSLHTSRVGAGGSISGVKGRDGRLICVESSTSVMSAHLSSAYDVEKAETGETDLKERGSHQGPAHRFQFARILAGSRSQSVVPPAFLLQFIPRTRMRGQRNENKIKEIAISTHHHP